VSPDLAGRTALITGGTAGVGLATGLALGRSGARCWLTYRWGSADPDDVRRQFAEVGAPEPVLVQSDVGSADDQQALVEQLASTVDRVDVFVSNAANAVVIRELEDWSLRGLQQSVRFAVWPTVGLTLALREALGAPRYVVAMSSDGPDHYTVGYDAIAATKAMLECVVRYLATRLRPEGTRVNAIRSRGIRTASFEAVFGPDLEAWSRAYVPQRWWVDPADVGMAALALCSGRMDAVNGQVLTIDRGSAFGDNLMRLFDDRDLLEGA